MRTLINAQICSLLYWKGRFHVESRVAGCDQMHLRWYVKMHSCDYPRDLGSQSATRLPFVSTTSLAGQTQPTPARIAFSITHGEGSDTESDPRWGWLGLACETIQVQAQ